MKIIYVNCRVKNYVKEDHRSYRRNFFSGFLFATAKVASITAMIFFHVTRRCGCLYLGVVVLRVRLKFVMCMRDMSVVKWCCIFEGLV